MEKITEFERYEQNSKLERERVLKYVKNVDKIRDLRTRSVWWFVETYLSESEFSYALNKSSHWAYIFHDQDFNEPHYHVLLHYENARTGSAVLRDFIGRQNTLIEIAKSPLSCYEYLTHKNDPDKYQYSAERIISHNPVYWESFLPDIRARNETDFLEDLLTNDKLDIVLMAKKYGRDFIKNYKAYMEFRREVYLQSKYYD